MRNAVLASGIIAACFLVVALVFTLSGWDAWEGFLLVFLGLGILLPLGVFLGVSTALLATRANWARVLHTVILSIALLLGVVGLGAFVVLPLLLAIGTLVWIWGPDGSQFFQSVKVPAQPPKPSEETLVDDTNDVPLQPPDADTPGDF